MNDPANTTHFEREGLLAALRRIGVVAVENRARLELMIDGGSALMLASNFRFATEDVDIAEIGEWPAWLASVTDEIAADNHWSRTWLNDAVTVYLSPLASKASDHVEFGMFPDTGEGFGLAVFVPTAEYMLALKLKAMRLLEPLKGQQEADDIYALMRVLKISAPEEAIQMMARYFPASGLNAEKQRFLLRHLRPSETATKNDAPSYRG